MKTGTKICCAFSLVVAVMLVVGYVGYRGIVAIGKNVADIGENGLPSVEHLNCARRGQLGPAYALRGMINRRMIRER